MTQSPLPFTRPVYGEGDRARRAWWEGETEGWKRTGASRFVFLLGFPPPTTASRRFPSP